MSAAGEITRLLRRMADQSGAARKHAYDELVGLAYHELKRRAHRQLRGERADSLQPTILVHAVYERLLQYRMPYEDSRHFMNVAATAMRRLLVERARGKAAEKRGGGQRANTLNTECAVEALGEDPDLLLDIEAAMDVLTPEQARLTELRFFVGFSMPETADIMGLNPETAKKRWAVIKKLLSARLAEWSRRGS
jgi:RNA polymerase sigma factor (TIGR02999 family)